MDQSLNMVTVDVTQGDIDGGVKSSPASCPLAFALSRSYGENVVVGVQSYFIGEGKDTLAFRLPKVLEDLRVAFDTGFHVEPFTLTFPEHVWQD